MLPFAYQKGTKMRYNVKDKLPEPNKIVIAFDKSGNKCFTFRTEEQDKEWILKSTDGWEFIPIEWEYANVDLDENDSRCPIQIAMEKYCKENTEGK